MVSAKCGVQLESIPEKAGEKTPDYKKSDSNLFFEVKTPSMIEWDYRTDAEKNDRKRTIPTIDKHILDELNAKLEMEEQLASGERIASAETVVQPYGNRPYTQGLLYSVISGLIEKTKQNLKEDQFRRGVTLLVLNLSLLPPFRTEPKAIRPAYPDDYLFPKALTGELWMAAFGDQGMLIHGMPEFEGKPSIERTFDKKGLLVEYDFIKGIIFICYPLGKPDPAVLAVTRSKDLEGLRNRLGKGFPCWNDEKDSQSYNLH